MRYPRIPVVVALAGALLGALAAGACSDDGTGPGNDDPDPLRNCTIDGQALTITQSSRDAIPSLSNPDFVDPDGFEATYLDGDDRVIGIVVEGEPLAVPLPVMKWHEILNLTRGGTTLAVTYCPLTATSVAFDRSAVEGREFGVSGFLFRNNLVMFDRKQGEESLWPQLVGQGFCGAAAGTELPTVPVYEMLWSKWRELHPTSTVVTENTGHGRNYEENPYAVYEELHEPPFSSAGGVDDRRPPKERVLGIPEGADGGVAIGFLDLEDSAVEAIDLDVDGRPVVAFWERLARAAVAYESAPEWADGMDAAVPETTTFRTEGGKILDDATGSEWTVDGRAVAGPAQGSRLVPVKGSMVAFWFAWADFHPETGIVTDF